MEIEIQHHLKSVSLALAALAGFCPTSPTVAAPAARPNVVVILADDMGYGDIRANNAEAKIPTPHLDRLVESGMNFTDAHTASSVCTPSRYSLLTGRYSWRTRLKHGVFDGFSPPLIEPSRPTIASVFKAAGYDTACFGKWHLGMHWTKTDGTPIKLDNKPPPGRRRGENIDFNHRLSGGPNAVGFDYYFGISASLDMSPYAWIENDQCLMGTPTKVEQSRELDFSWDAGFKAPEFRFDHVLPELKRRTVDWISQHEETSPDKPFFLYLPLNSPHLPAVPSVDFRGQSRLGVYGDFMMETDDYVGAVVAALKKAGVYENTLIVFTSDNGGLWHAWDPVEKDDVAGYDPSARGLYNRSFGLQSNGALRGTKADIWEGGHRVPFIVSWPGKIKTAQTSRVPVEVTDIFATLVDAVDLPLPDQAAPDSFSFFGVLEGKGAKGTMRPFLVHHSIRGVFAVREGNWKYVESLGSGGFSKPSRVKAAPGEAMGQLFNMKGDWRETSNRFLEEPERVAHFKALLDLIKKSPNLRLSLNKEPL